MANDDRDLSARFAPIVVVIALLAAGSLVPKGGPVPKKSVGARRHLVMMRPHGRDDIGVSVASGLRGRRPRPTPPSDSHTVADLSAYKDLGSWIDIYDRGPWDHPPRAVRRLHRRGAKTIFLQTSNYGARKAIFRPRQTMKFLRAAHRRDMRVVAWSVPSFSKPKIDYHRARAAIRFERKGQRFDSFGLDIEASIVGDIARRNARLLNLSSRLRKLVGPDYTLAAITPDPVEAGYWPNFPYKNVAKVYDVFVPMGYFSFRTKGYRGVKRYTLASIRNIRRESGDPDVPIHFIGGLGGETRRDEVTAFVRTVRSKKNVLGASYYDFSVTAEHEWNQLKALVRKPMPVAPKAVPELPEPRPTPLETTAVDVRASDHDKTKKADRRGNGKSDGRSKHGKKRGDNERDRKKSDGRQRKRRRERS